MTCLFSHHLCVRSQHPLPPKHGSSKPQVLSALTVSGTQEVKAGGPLLRASPLEANFYFSLTSRKILFHDTETTALLSGRIEVPRRSSAPQQYLHRPSGRGAAFLVPWLSWICRTLGIWPQRVSHSLTPGIFRASRRGSLDPGSSWVVGPREVP